MGNNPIFCRLKKYGATAKATGIFLRDAAKVTWAPRATLSVIFRRSIEQALVDANATRCLQKAAAIAIAKLETDTDVINERSNKMRLLLSLKLRNSAFGSRCIKSGGISGAT